MGMYFTQEHEVIRKSVREFIAREITPYMDEWEEAGEFPALIFKKLGDLGILGLRCPEKYGGIDADLFSALVIAEEMAQCGGAGLPMSIAVQSDMVIPTILKFGSEEQIERFLLPAIKGEIITALAITEPDAGSDVAGIKTFAVKDGDEWVINGSKMFITNGPRADVVIVVVKTEKAKGYLGVTLFLVEKGMPGFTVSKKLDKLGMRSSDTGELSFIDCRVPHSNVLGRVGEGFYHIMWELQGERVAAAAGAVAVAQYCLDMGIKYAKERVQFERPISKFQVIRHRFAELSAQLEAVRQFVYHMVYRIDNGEYPVKEISMCKLLSSRLAFEIADFVLQVHGGYGYMTEYPISRLWRDIRLYRIGAGTDEIMLEIISKQLNL
ncbi:MAG: acyl-CoA dehydrogenase family protein [Dethiobacter sp.]|jgi:alkylation response protein AidB-like acyl-CoA dehydrogenase|nr:acyl-CoA dehydrogenase family protein [Dethiobacter sp.]